MSSGYKPGTSLTGPLTNTDDRQAAPRAWQGKLPHAWEPSSARADKDFTVPSDYNESIDWDVVEIGTGSRSVAQEEFGLLRLTTGASNGNQEAIFLKDKYWTTSSGQRLWHKSRVKLSAGAQGTVTLLFGLSVGNPNDRISFDLANGSNLIRISCNRGGSLTQTILPGTYDLSVYQELAFVTDGQRVDFYINNQRVGTITTNIPLPATTMRTSYLLVTNSAAARSLDIDYFLTAKQRKAGDQG